MKRLKYMIAALICVSMTACGGGSADPDTLENTSTPTAITLSQSSFSVAQAGETLSLTIESPARPKINGMPSWITLTDGTFNNYKITFGLTVAANSTYDERSVTMTVTSTGASSVNLTITQAGLENISDMTLPDNDAVAMSNKLGLGWNMGNHMDAFYNYHTSEDASLDLYDMPDENVWGNADCTQETFTKVKAAGFSSVRIPVTWLRKIGEAPDYKIDEAWMNRVAEIVGYAHNAGLNVIVNTHHDECNNDGHWLDIKNAALNSSLNATIKAEITAVWTQIANKFKDCGDWLIMESFNELQDGGWGWSSAFLADPTKQCNILNEWNQVFVDAVRATGGNNSTRWLGVPTYAANPSFIKYLTLPNDSANKIMVSVHFYDPSEYTTGFDTDDEDTDADKMYMEWGHTGNSSDKASWGDEDHVKEVFNNLYTKYTANNIPVYIGEFGASMRDRNNSRAWAFYVYYLEYIVKAAKSYGMPCFLWDNGAKGDGIQQHGYINHGTGAYIGASKDVIDVMVNARNNTSSNYTLQYVYDHAPTF